jgi:hypothetical protein
MSMACWYDKHHSSSSETGAWADLSCSCLWRWELWNIGTVAKGRISGCCPSKLPHLRAAISAGDSDSCVDNCVPHADVCVPSDERGTRRRCTSIDGTGREACSGRCSLERPNVSPTSCVREVCRLSRLSVWAIKTQDCKWEDERGAWKLPPYNVGIFGYLYHNLHSLRYSFCYLFWRA